MLAILFSLILSTIAVFVAANILSGVHVDGWGTALVVAIILGFINAFIRPILLLLTLPINVLTLGLFTFVIMAFCVILTTYVVSGFTVDGFWWALAFALVLSLINSFLSAFTL